MADPPWAPSILLIERGLSWKGRWDRSSAAEGTRHLLGRGPLTAPMLGWGQGLHREQTGGSLDCPLLTYMHTAGMEQLLC
jgi:hypothetical protein